MIPKGYVRADADGLLYKREDTEWIVQPTHDDPGVLQPKPGAISLEQQEREDWRNWDDWGLGDEMI